MCLLAAVSPDTGWWTMSWAPLESRRVVPNVRVTGDEALHVEDAGEPPSRELELLHDRLRLLPARRPDLEIVPRLSAIDCAAATFACTITSSTLFATRSWVCW